MFLMIENPMYNHELAFVGSRAASGIMNGAFYSDLYGLGFLGAIGTVALTILSIRRRKKDKNKYKKFRKPWLNKLEEILFWFSFALSLFSIVAVIISFAGPAIPFLDIHLWTYLTQLFQGFCMFLNEPKQWWRLLLLITPAVFFQKYFANLITGKPWNYQGTNDPTGKTFKILGKDYPRMFNGNMYVRLGVTLGSILVLWLTKNEKTKLKIRNFFRPKRFHNQTN